MPPSSFLTSFLGAIQASLVVLLTIFCGALTYRFNLLSVSSSNDISKLCAYVFMPALLATGIGKELTLSKIQRYVPIIIWGLVHPFISMAIGLGLRKLTIKSTTRTSHSQRRASIISKIRINLNVPHWVVPAMAFNNSTSLPLVLIQSLQSTGVLDKLMETGESRAEALSRAKSYLLVHAMVSNSLAFTLGPKLLAQRNDSSPDDGEGSGTELERGIVGGREAGTDEQVSLLHSEETTLRSDSASTKSTTWLKSLSSTLISSPVFLSAVLGVILGITPPLHTAFFAPSYPLGEGIFSGWLTTAVSNVGDLFASLQLVVVGSKLAMGISRMRKGEESGSVPSLAVILVFLVRFILWPIVSIAVIYTIKKHTNLLSDDPILWFALMIIPTGPPAAKLSTLADVGDSDDKEKLAIAKFLTVAYVVSPVICLAVVGSLKTSESLM